MSTSMALPTPVLPTSELRTLLGDVLKSFREHGALSTPIVFGAQRRPEGVMIPYELYTELLPVIEDVEIAHLVRERAEEGPSVPLADVASSLGLNPDDYR